jgi:hypothetical protein
MLAAAYRRVAVQSRGVLWFVHNGQLIGLKVIRVVSRASTESPTNHGSCRWMAIQDICLESAAIAFRPQSTIGCEDLIGLGCLQSKWGGSSEFSR